MDLWGLKMKSLLAAVLSIMSFVPPCLAVAASAPDQYSERVRAMWVWKTDLLIKHAHEREMFLVEAESLGLTDVYLYLQADSYSLQEDELSVLIKSLDDAGMRAWGLEGWRGYFSDGEGPADLFSAIDALIGFNSRHAVGFVGFHSNLEPQDGQGVGVDLFVNGIPESRLKPDELASRDRILSEWIDLHEQLLRRAAAGGVRYGASMPSWVDDYYGEPVNALHGGERRLVLSHILPLVSQYVIMSYNTDPSNVKSRIIGEMDYAEHYNGSRIMFSLEVHPNVGENISYADTVSKSRRSAVISDLKIIESAFADRSSYLGWSIHDWEGWRMLSP